MKVQFFAVKSKFHQQYENTHELIMSMVENCSKEQCIYDWYTAPAMEQFVGMPESAYRHHLYGAVGNHYLKYRREDGVYIIEDLSSSIEITVKDDRIDILMEGTRGAFLQNSTAKYAEKVARACWFDDIMELGEVETHLPEYFLPAIPFEEQHQLFFKGEDITVEEILGRARQRAEQRDSVHEALVMLDMAVESDADEATQLTFFERSFGVVIQSHNQYMTALDEEWSWVRYGGIHLPLTDKEVCELEDEDLDSELWYKYFKNNFLENPKKWIDSIEGLSCMKRRWLSKQI